MRYPKQTANLERREANLQKREQSDMAKHNGSHQNGTEKFEPSRRSHQPFDRAATKRRIGSCPEGVR
jgi:hypothetical protein